MEIIEKENEREIIEKIKSVIISRHPIVEDRFDAVMNCPTPRMDILIKVIRVEDQDYTVIMFMDGDENARISIPERIKIKGLIKPSTINELIFEILLDHDLITSGAITKEKIVLNFGVDVREDNLTGISCAKILLEVKAPKHPDEKNIIDSYSEEIIKVYTSELQYVPYLNSDLIRRLLERK